MRSGGQKSIVALEEKRIILIVFENFHLFCFLFSQLYLPLPKGAGTYGLKHFLPLTDPGCATAHGSQGETQARSSGPPCVGKRLLSFSLSLLLLLLS